MEKHSPGQSAIFSLLGHKGDLMFIHFRESFADLNQAELKLANLRLSDYLEPTTSYLSIIELGTLRIHLKIYKALVERGIEPHSDEWKREIADTLARQKEAMRPRLFPEFRRIATPASIPWTAAAAKTRTGTSCPSKNAPAR